MFMHLKMNSFTLCSLLYWTYVYTRSYLARPYLKSTEIEAKSTFSKVHNHYVKCNLLNLSVENLLTLYESCKMKINLCIYGSIQFN